MLMILTLLEISGTCVFLLFTTSVPPVTLHFSNLRARELHLFALVYIIIVTLLLLLLS